MSRPDRVPDSEYPEPFPPLHQEEGELVFAEPWQAEAFGIAVTLSQQGYFTQKEWAAALAAEIKAAASRGEVDDGSRYYEHWLAALERLVVEKGLCDVAALAARKKAWVKAYKRTPHGKPIVLSDSDHQ